MSDTSTAALSEQPFAAETAHAETEVAARERAIIVVTSLGHALCHIGELVFTGTVSAVMIEFGLTPVQVVTLAWLGYCLMGIGALPFGYWSDRWGPALLLRVYFVAMAVAALGVTLTRDVFTLFAALTLLGIAASIYHPVGLALISLGVRDRGRAMGINGAAGSFGVATGPALGMLAVYCDVWRLAFFVLAGLALSCLALMWFWMPGEATAIQPAGRPRHVREEDSAAGRSTAMFGDVALVLLMASMMLGGFNYRCLVTALPPYLTGQAPGSADMARGSLFVWVALVVGGIGQYLGGCLADGHRARRIYIGLITTLLPLAALLANAEGTPVATWVACGLAVCLFAQQPIENIILADWTTAHRRSLSYATKFALTFGFGALGAPVVGLIWTYYQSLGPAFYLLGGSAAVMAGLSLSAVRVRAQSRPS